MSLMRNEYDIGIIGGGPAGYTAALALAKQGKKVILFEEDKAGGTCLHRGCVPMKSLLHNIEAGDVEAAVKRASEDVNTLYKGLFHRLSSTNIEIVSEFCRILGREATGIELSAEDVDYTVSSLIISTGSYQQIPNIEGLEAGRTAGYILLPDDVLKTTTWGKKIAIIGGGVTGLEIASYLSKQDKEVIIFEIADGILGDSVDDDLLSVYYRGLKDISILCGTSVSEIDDRTVIYETGGKYDEKEFDQIIVASGRKGKIDGIGLENLNIETSNGFIMVNNQCQTNIDGVYACGDVIGLDMLAHVAYKEADVAVSHILGVEQHMTYDAIPKVVYTDPEFAQVGVSERELINDELKEGTDYYICKSAMTYSSRYVILEGLLPGACKMIFNKDDILIGAQIIGNGAGELIGWVADMVANRESRDRIRNKIYPHPSICEILRETVR